MSYVKQRLSEICASPPESPEAKEQKLRRMVEGGRMPNLGKEKTRHGKTIWYYREGKGKRIRLPDKDKVKKETFERAYLFAATGKPVRIAGAAPKKNAVLGDPGRPGYVYFLRSGENVKIGFTTNMKQRISTLQTSSAERLELMKALPGTSGTEKALHDIFDEYRMDGEWFKLKGLLSAFLDYNEHEVTRKKIGRPRKDVGALTFQQSNEAQG